MHLAQVKPMPKAGWQLATTKSPYANDNYGSPVTEGVTEIVWTGGNLPDDWHDEFVFRARLTDFSEGSVVYFPIVQVCADGAVDRWTEVPEASAGVVRPGTDEMRSFSPVAP